MPIEVDRLSYFLARNKQLLLAQCERTGVITDPRYVLRIVSFTWRAVVVCNFSTFFCCSNIVHDSAGLGLFAAKDFKKGDVFGSYFGALFLGHKGVFVKLYKLLNLLAINNTYHFCSDVSP